MNDETGKLMQQYYATNDADKRRAITARIKELERQDLEDRPVEILDALSYPQRKLKEAVSGSEDNWIPGGYKGGTVGGLSENASEMLYDMAGNTTDLFADPVNLLGAGIFKKGGQALESMGAGAKAGRGMLSANLDNYIKDFYGKGDRDLTMVEKAIAPLIKKWKPDVPEERLGDLTAKNVNTAGTLAKGGAAALKSLLSPSDRALWKTQGVSRGGQDVIQGHLDDIAEGLGSRSQSKAVAEANYQLHNAFQGGREGATHPSLAGIGAKSNLETYTPNEPGTITGWMDKHAGSKLDPDTGEYVPIKMSPEETKYIEEHVMRDWDGAEGVVMKKPASKQSGDHRNDALSAKNPTMGGINRSFKALDKAGTEKTVDSLYDELVKQQKFRQKQVDKDPRLENFNIVGRDEEGIWIRTSKSGSAITEGGVNILTRVKPDGEHFSVVSDKHDFLEKVKGLGPAVRAYLPNDLVAVTPPMYGHVYNKPARLANGKKGKSPYRLTSSDQKPAKGTPSWTEDLEGIASARPTEAAVNAERMRSAGMLAPLINESTKED